MKTTRLQKLLLAAAAVFCVAVVSHMSALGNNYVLDDFRLILKNGFISHWSNIGILFDPHYLFTPYPIKCGARPLTVLTLLVDHQLWGYNPFGYHLTNIVLHGCNTVGVFFLAVLLLDTLEDRRWGIAVLAALIFALHPLQAEVVNIASFRADVLAVFFYVVALGFFITAFKRCGYASGALYAGAVISFVIALFAKEMALSLPLSVLLYLLTFKHKVSTRKMTLIAVSLGVVISCFFLCFWNARFIYSLSTTIFPNIRDNLSPVSSFPAYINTLISSFLHYVVALLFPVRLSIDYLIVSGKTLLVPRLLLSLGIVAALGMLFHYSRDKLLKFGVGMWLVSYLPVSNILPLVNTANDRYMYLPMVGFCLAVSSAVYHVHDRRIGGRISLRFLLMVALLLSCSWLTVKRNSVFDDSYSLYSDAVRYVPDNIRVRYNLGLANMLRKNSRKAINEFEEVTRLNPFYKRNDVWFLTGVCYEQMGDYTRAKQYCKKGTLLRMRKDALTAYAGMLWKEGDLDQAALFMQVNAHFYPDPITYCNLGRYYARMNDLSQAVECFKKAVEMEPVDPVMWGCLLNACNRLGDGKLVEKETYRMIAALSRNGGYLERTTDGEIFHVSRRDFR